MSTEYVDMDVPRVLAVLLVGPEIDNDQWTRPRRERALLLRLSGSVDDANRLYREWCDMADEAQL